MYGSLEYIAEITQCQFLRVRSKKSTAFHPSNTLLHRPHSK